MSAVRPDRENIPAPPVVLVTGEARFTDSPRLRQQDTLDAIAIALEARFPISESISGTSLEESGSGAPPRLVPRRALVLRNTASTEAITLTSSSVAIETTEYRDFVSLQRTLGEACRALAAHVTTALTRVGLRYINEVRVPEPVTDARSWTTWIDPSIMGFARIAPEGVPVRALQGAVAFDLGNGGGLKIGYAAVDQGTVVNHRLLVRPPVPAGPFFALDFDGFYEFKADAPILLGGGRVTEILGALHTPISAAFQRAITRKARSSFFRGARSFDGDVPVSGSP